MLVRFKLEEGINLPKYETEGSAGMDVTANSIIKAYKGDVEITGEKFEKMKEGFKERGYIKLRPFERILFGTGVTVAELAQGFELQVRSRSGVSLKRGLLVANSPGTVDSDYRGEVGVIIYNSTPFLNQVTKGEKIAQLVSSFAPKLVIESTEEVSITDRGAGGYGSTTKA